MSTLLFCFRCASFAKVEDIDLVVSSGEPIVRAQYRILDEGYVAVIGVPGEGGPVRRLCAGTNDVTKARWDAERREMCPGLLCCEL